MTNRIQFVSKVKKSEVIKNVKNWSIIIWKIVFRSIEIIFSNFSGMFLNHNIFSNLNSYCSNVLVWETSRNKIKKTKKWLFTAWINCSNDLKSFANSWHSASNFKSFSRSIEQFFLIVGQNNCDNKMQLTKKVNFDEFWSSKCKSHSKYFQDRTCLNQFLQQWFNFSWLFRLYKNFGPIRDDAVWRLIVV